MLMHGCYRVPALSSEQFGAFTNKMATDAIRGAGRPEATHMIEVCIDQLAQELGTIGLLGMHLDGSGRAALKVLEGILAPM